MYRFIIVKEATLMFRFQTLETTSISSQTQAWKQIYEIRGGGQKEDPKKLSFNKSF